MATHYTHVLAAMDLAHDNSAVIDRAVEIARRYQAGLTLMRVVEDIAAHHGEDPSFFDTVSIQKGLIDLATNQMNKLRMQIAVPGVKTRIETGTPKREIVRIADDEKADPVVIGSHGRHGLQSLLGSTANGMRHLANCDVLAIRVDD